MKMNAWFCLLWYQTKAQFSAKVLRNESTQETQENTQRQNWTTQRKRNTSRRRRFFFSRKRLGLPRVLEYHSSSKLLD